MELFPLQVNAFTVPQRSWHKARATHPPREGRDILLHMVHRRPLVSIHAPRAGRDKPFALCGSEHPCFNPRAPRGARRLRRRKRWRRLLVSIHAPRAGRDGSEPPVTSTLIVSIHAPRAGRDAFPELEQNTGVVSIHAPRAGRDNIDCSKYYAQVLFQSTRPARGATWYSRRASTTSCSFNPRAPRGARLRGRALLHERGRFNPRAPRGARHPGDRDLFCLSVFQSTRPARGATSADEHSQRLEQVSIHAPRAGRDASGTYTQSENVVFQSTRPARGATHSDRPERTPKMVSIHAPRAGRDAKGVNLTGSQLRFNPRAPRGARRFGAAHKCRSKCFNPRAPRGARPEFQRRKC